MTQEMLSFAKARIRQQYLDHEIDADTFAQLSEDIRIVEIRNAR